MTTALLPATEPSFLERLGAATLSIVEGWGRAWIFLVRTVYVLLRYPFRLRQFIEQIYHIGAMSSLVISLIGAFTGAVLAVQGEYTLAKFGATGYTGSAVALSLFRELGPVLTALMVIGRAGSAITAELGIMKITEQLDALKSMAVDPHQYLMAPRLLAGIVSMPLLCCLFILTGVAGGYVVGVTLLNLSPGVMIADVAMMDIYSGLIKATVFGLIFGWVSCYKGYTSGYGAVGVNRATTQSVVTSSVAVLVVDYFLTSFLTRIIFQ